MCYRKARRLFPSFLKTVPIPVGGDAIRLSFLLTQFIVKPETYKHGRSYLVKQYGTKHWSPLQACNVSSEYRNTGTKPST